MGEHNSQKVLSHVEDGVGWLTINTPERHNAIQRDMWLSLAEVLGNFSERADVRVVVICGAGNRAFSSGADIHEFADKVGDTEYNDDYDRKKAIGVAALNGFEKPLVAMINGYCVGGGFYLSGACDIRFASEKSTFSITGASLGLAYGYDIISKLVYLVGPSWAADILFSARFLEAKDALAIGLVNFVLPEETLKAEVSKYAGLIARNAPLSIKSSKKTIQECTKDHAMRDFDRISQLMTECDSSADAKEGIQAYVEKRAAQFKGR